jgi:hypothetical protein
MENSGIHILWPFGQFSDRVVFFIALWYRYFVVNWYVFPVLVYCTSKNLATLSTTTHPEEGAVKLKREIMAFFERIIKTLGSGFRNKEFEGSILFSISFLHS